MQAVGVVVEYNPFHNGHLYHLQQAKEASQATVVIAVMSGQFLQRGEPAIVDKWTRTQMALLNGADIVFELPFHYSTAQAKDFAKGAVTLLDAACCHDVAFGTEDGDIALFYNTWHLLKQDQVRFNQFIQQQIKTGVSYPKAMQYAFSQLTGNENTPYADLTQPNNILGFEYIKAAQPLAIRPIAIQRIAAHYHDTSFHHQTIASATAIRHAMQQNMDITPMLPSTSQQLLQQFIRQQASFMDWEKLYPFLRFSLLQLSLTQLQHFADVTEGIEYALKRYAKTCHSFAEFITALKSKRYTRTRLQRMLTQILLGVTKEERHYQEPTYLRLLGMTTHGQQYIKQFKKQFTLPLISRVGATTNTQLQLDCKATDIYSLGLKQALTPDYKRTPIRL